MALGLVLPTKPTDHCYLSLPLPLPALTASASPDFVSTKVKDLDNSHKGRRGHSFCKKDGNASRLLGIFTYF